MRLNDLPGGFIQAIWQRGEHGLKPVGLFKVSLHEIVTVMISPGEGPRAPFPHDAVKAAAYSLREEQWVATEQVPGVHDEVNIEFLAHPPHGGKGASLMKVVAIYVHVRDL